MQDDSFRVMELALQGFNCSQILVLIALEAQGRENSDLVRAMSGLLTGLGCGRICGALTGGCCVLGMYAGKDSVERNADSHLTPMLSNFVEWFETEYTARFGGINCSDIVRDDARNRMTRCPAITIETLAKIKELLEESDYDFTRPESI
ncbi:MAG: C-GCAxxG-C-C family protein [Acidobacteriota bacterium]|nr:C-GCAxxG-C-C family protein [Acidobacteriota bacterium]